ncbi:MAG: Hsp20 family protein [Gemmatimonas sp.]|nr:Hsp20 family protein [Gemmatimonas sp.]
MNRLSPVFVDADKIHAHFQNGILSVCVPKSERPAASDRGPRQYDLAEHRRRAR